MNSCNRMKEMNISSSCRFNLGDLRLQKGGTLKDAQITYITVGELNKAKDNVVLYPTHYSGNHESNLNMIGKDRVLSPEKYFIVIPNMFGNGLSTSPSNAHCDQRNNQFPLVTVLDNVQAQRKLLLTEFDIDKIKLAFGWSMGGQQAYQWAASYPYAVEQLVVSCSSPRTSIINKLFLDMLRTALSTDNTLSDSTPSPQRGLRAFGRIYASWAYSHNFYRNKEYQNLGYDSFEHLLEYWEEDHIGWNAYDLLAMLQTWWNADISDNETYNKNLTAALRAIQSKSLVMPAQTDMYFPPEDTICERNELQNLTYTEIPSLQGHMSGSPSASGEERQFIEQTLRTFLT